MASNIQPIKQVGSVGAWSDGFTYTFPEGASQSWLIGAPVKFSSGTVVVISSVTAPAMAGVAMAAAGGVTQTNATASAKIAMALGEVIFEVSVDTTTTNNTAALGTGTPSQFSIGTSYQMLLDSTSGNYYMGSGTGNPVFTLLSYDPGQNSVVNGRVWVRILASQTAWT